MIQTAIRLTARVLPGKRVEFTAPELTEGADVDIFVALPQEIAPPAAPDKQYVSALDFIASLPPSTLTAADWERIERELQEEKNAWE